MSGESSRPLTALLVKSLQDRLRPLHWGVASCLPLRWRRHYMHLVKFGRPGNFTTPTSFNEKVNWRILNDRRPIIAAMCDKERMKDLAAASQAEVRIPRTIWRGKDLTTAPDLDSIGRWVLKPNHSSGAVIFGPEPGTDPAVESRGWLKSVPFQQLGEWGYGEARAELLLEERLPGSERPADYKFYVFDGVPRMIQVNAARKEQDETATFYDPEWVKLPVSWISIPAGDEPRPDNLDTMLDVAATLGQGLDFIRVDLYSIGGEVWFGELSPYPGGGMMRFLPGRFATELGGWWRLPPLAEVAG